MLSAIQITTSSAICTMLDLLAAGRIPSRGVIRHEDIPLDVFLANRFGQVFAKEGRAGRAGEHHDLTEAVRP
jgi:saccharopine dehydrogenase-like NADP-dependent oxidoreductase